MGMKTLYEKSKADQSSFCIENGGSSEDKPTPLTFLTFDKKHPPAYCSWILQHDQTTQEEFYKEIAPHKQLPEKQQQQQGEVVYGTATWVFVARNDSTDSLVGRPPHTDSVSHDGTFH